MKTINLYFKFAFTALSPNAEPISLGIVSDDGKTLYAEFSDFNINHCDDWVKDNIVSKLEWKRPVGTEFNEDYNDLRIAGPLEFIKKELHSWVDQYKNCHVQFVCDCSYLSAMWIFDLLDERLSHKGVLVIPEPIIPKDVTKKEFMERLCNELHRTAGCGAVIGLDDHPEIGCVNCFKKGLPMLPEYISSITEDLNALIAIKKGISTREAFDMSRQELANDPVIYSKLVHNSLYDAQIIKNIYDILTR